MAGILITHEGPDGSGKATQAALLRTWLESQGLAVEFYAFPTYETSSIAQLIRTMLHDRREEWTALPWEARALLYIANRVQYRREICDHLRDGKIVLCDRYSESNFAHLAGLVNTPEERRHMIKQLSHMEFEDLQMPPSNIVFLHTMRPEHRQALIFKREGGTGDVNESNSEYLHNVEQTYIMMAEDQPERFCHIPSDENGNLQAPEEIHQRVLSSLQRHVVWREWSQAQVTTPV